VPSGRASRPITLLVLVKTRLTAAVTGERETVLRWLLQAVKGRKARGSRRETRCLKMCLKI